MNLKARGTTVLITPVNLGDVQRKTTLSMGVENKAKKLSNTILWRIVSVGEGTDFATANGLVRIPVPFKPGDVVLLNTTDEYLREHWQTSNFDVNGTPVVWTVGWRNDSSSGDVLGIVED